MAHLKSDIFTIGGDFDENCVSLTAKNIDNVSDTAVRLGSTNLREGAIF